jgi:hypothetical protein
VLQFRKWLTIWSGESANLQDANEKKRYAAVLEAGLKRKQPAPRSVARKCQHGRRQKHKCNDCGTGYCQHGRQKDQCKDCGAGYCDHGRRKSQCKDCGAGYCQHGRQKSQCREGLRDGLLPARAPGESVQGLRYGLLPARAHEWR